MTVPVFQGFTEATEVNFFLVIAKPSGVVENDLMIAVIVCNANPPIATSSGWTVVQSSQTSAVTITTLYKIAGASEDTSYSFGFFPATVPSYGFIVRITGHNNSTPINVSGLGIGDSATPTCPSVLTDEDDCLILRIFGADDDDITVNSGYPVDTIGITVNKNSTDPNSCSGGAAYEAQASAGASGTAAFALTAAEEWIAMTVAIEPAPTVTVLPDAFALALSQPAPTIEQDYTVLPTTLSLALTLQTPSLSIGCTVSPSALQLVAALHAPTGLFPVQTILPTCFALALSQHTPSLHAGSTVSVSAVLALALTQLEPEDITMITYPPVVYDKYRKVRRI